MIYLSRPKNLTELIFSLESLLKVKMQVLSYSKLSNYYKRLFNIRDLYVSHIMNY